MKILKRALADRRIVLSLLGGYFVVSAYIGGPWFALFTGGLVTLVAGFFWWLAREKRLQILGIASLLVGAAMTGGGVYLGNTPHVLPDESLPYTPVVPRPTVPVFDLLPLPSLELIPTPSPKTTTRAPQAQPAANQQTRPADPFVVPGPAPVPARTTTPARTQAPRPPSDDPVTTDPEPTTDPTTTEPTTDPGTTEPTTDPGPTEPTTDPAPVEPQPVEPQPVEPQPVEPQPVEPQPVEPQPVEPEPEEPAPAG